MDSPPPPYSTVAECLTDNLIDGEEMLIIGLDFGTTYSGVSYAFTTNPEDIYTINEWPGARGRTSPKCPTLIKYNELDDYIWGFELDWTTGSRIEGIKLLLDPDQPKPLYVPPLDTEAELKRLGKSVIVVVTDYIRAIFQHALRMIESKYPANYVKTLKKQYVLTVPAVWSDKAKNATLQAARDAGISPIKLIKEPEAAALFTLKQMGRKGLKPGDALVLCDAGGGTVDLISYEIIKLEPFELKELTDCTGGLAGSLMLNKQFEEWIKGIVGKTCYSKLQNSDAYRRAMKTFDEHIKPGFRTRNDRDEYINFPLAKLPDNRSKGLLSDTITVKGNTLHDIFHPVFCEIERLLKEQIASVRLRRLRDKHPAGDRIEAIFLVGGFGSSAYLKESIQAAYNDIEIIQPNDAWSAIVRGAVMSQLPYQAKVIINFAPKHYGISCRDVYSESRDTGQETFWDSHQGCFRVKVMAWYIHKGDHLHRARTIKFPFHRTFAYYPSHDDLQFESKLLECSLENAPDHPKYGITRTNVTLFTDLSSVPTEYIKKKRRLTDQFGVVEWWEVHYDLVVHINSGPMIFGLSCGDKEYGKVNVEY